MDEREEIACHHLGVEREERALNSEEEGQAWKGRDSSGCTKEGRSDGRGFKKGT